MTSGPGNGQGSNQETVIAEVSGLVRAIALLFPVIVLVSSLFVPSLALGAIMVVLAVGLFAVAWRVRAMRLAVSAGGVQVVNFASEHTFAIDGVKLEVEEEESQWPTDDIPAASRGASGDELKIGSLFLSDGADKRMKVGVVPSYGNRRLVIIEDLKIALAQHRL